MLDTINLNFSELIKEIFYSTIFNVFAFLTVYLGFAFFVDKFLEKRTNLSYENKKNEIIKSIKSFTSISPLIGILFIVLENYSLCYNNLSDYSYTWWVISIILYFLINDAVFYWLHRLLHNDYIYKFSHYSHHGCKPPSSFTAAASDRWELLTEGLISTFIPMFIIPVHYITGRLVAIFIIFWSCTIHAHVDFFEYLNKNSTLYKFIKYINLEKIIITSKKHHIHHKYGKNNYNFSMFFTLWDYICGTYKETE